MTALAPLAILVGGIVAMWLFCEAAVAWIARHETPRTTAQQQADAEDAELVALAAACQDSIDVLLWELEIEGRAS